MIRLLSLILILFLSNSLSSGPAQVILIRHAEADPTTGQLNLRGLERAAAMVPFFQGDPLVTQFGVPVAIYAAGSMTANGSSATTQTVAGIASVSGLPVIDQFVTGQAPDLARAIYNNRTYDGRTVLVCVSYLDIPSIAHAMGANVAPAKWPPDVYDRLWIISFDPGGGIASFLDAPQKLLFGDAPL